jgi:hypothetical protein
MSAFRYFIPARSEKSYILRRTSPLSTKYMGRRVDVSATASYLRVLSRSVFGGSPSEAKFKYLQPTPKNVWPNARGGYRKGPRAIETEDA